MKYKPSNDADKNQSFEKLYQGYNEFNEFFQNNDSNNFSKYDSSFHKRNFIERRIYEQRFGVFGNALITVAVIAVIVGILYLICR